MSDPIKRGMKILLFGAMGPTGRLILKNLLRDGHRALFRAGSQEAAAPGVPPRDDGLDSGRSRAREGDRGPGSRHPLAGLETDADRHDDVSGDGENRPGDGEDRRPEDLHISTLGIRKTHGMLGTFFTCVLQPLVLKNNFAEKARQEEDPGGERSGLDRPASRGPHPRPADRRVPRRLRPRGEDPRENFPRRPGRFRFQMPGRERTLPHGGQSILLNSGATRPDSARRFRAREIDLSP